MSDDATNALEQVLDEIDFNADGLIAAIAQQHDTGEVLMLAWMRGYGAAALHPPGVSPRR